MKKNGEVKVEVKTSTRIIVKVGFQYLHLYRLSLSVHTSNTNAVAAYIKSGFIFEGLIRDVIKMIKAQDVGKWEN